MADDGGGDNVNVLSRSINRRWKYLNNAVPLRLANAHSKCLLADCRLVMTCQQRRSPHFWDRRRRLQAEIPLPSVTQNDGQCHFFICNHLKKSEHCIV